MANTVHGLTIDATADSVYEAHHWKSTALDLLALLLISLPACIPLVAPGFLQGHDSADPPWRSLQLMEALRDGVLFPRWAPDLYYGYGFPIFNFYSPLGFYPIALLGALTPMDLVSASKLTFALSLVLAGFGAYSLSRVTVGHRGAALLAGVLYMYATTTLGTVYVRTALATSVALALIPFVLVAFVRLCRKPSLTATGVAAALLTILVLTHNLTSVVTAGMVATLVVLRVLRSWDRRVLLLSGLALILGIGAASFFWIPAVADLGLVHSDRLAGGGASYNLHFVEPLGDVDDTIATRIALEPYEQTSWGPLDLHLAYPYGIPPYKLGLLEGLLFLLWAGMLLVRRRDVSLDLAWLFLLAVGFFFLHTSWSRFLWEAVPGMEVLQFPWRLNALVALCLAVGGSWALLPLARRWRLVLPLVGAAAMLSSLWLLPKELAPFDGGVEITREALIRHEYLDPNRAGTMTDGQFLPLSVQWDEVEIGLRNIMRRYDQSYPPERWIGKTAYLAPDSNGWILAARRGYQRMQALVEVGDETRMAFHTIYFPGWTAYLDGRQVPIEPSPWQEYEEGRRAALGVVQVLVPPGRHLVTLAFESTPVRQWAAWFATANLLGIALLLLVPLGRRAAGERPALRIPGPVAVAVLGAGLGFLIWQGLSAPRPIAWVENRVVLDLVQQTERRAVKIEVPAGAKPDDHVHPRSFTIQGDSRPVLYMHPSASAASRVWLPEGARLEFALGVDPGVWDKTGDGVHFEVDVREGDAVTRLLSAYVDPKSNPADRRWHEHAVDLGPFAGRQVELVLRTLPGESGDFDWAGWAKPRVILP